VDGTPLLQRAALTGEATASAGSNTVTLTNSAIIGKVLTGFSAGAGAVAATDTILQAFNKVVGNIAALVTGVSTVFGRSGAVVATSGDYTTAQVTESGNLYFTDERAQDAVGAMVDTTLTYVDGTPLLQRAALTGDVTCLAGSNTTAIASGVIVNADVNASAAIAVSKLAALTASRAMVTDGSGFASVATTTATELGYVNGVTSAIQTQLNAKAPTASPTFTGTVTLPAGQVVNGVTLTTGGGTTTFLNANGAYSTPAAGGVSDGDKGDITVSGSGTTWTIDNGVVTLAKQADMATSSLVYRKTAGSGAPEINTLATLKTDLGLTGTNSGDQSLFSTIAVSGQSDVVADSTSDTLTLVAGSNITITTDASTDSVTIAASGGGSSPTEVTTTGATELEVTLGTANCYRVCGWLRVATDGASI
jgi:hypothetical protein